MPQQPESRLQRRIRTTLEERIGGVWTKIHGGAFQEAGIGDLMGCVQGLHIEVEVKTERGRVRPSQILRSKRIRRAGGAYIIARTPDEAVNEVSRHLAKHGKTPEHRASTGPKKGVFIRLQDGTLRPVHAAKDWKDLNLTPRHRKAVAQKIGETSYHHRSKNCD